jgi:hypothetical protein
MISRSDDVLAGLLIIGFLFSRMSVARLIGLCGFAWARSTYRQGLLLVRYLRRKVARAFFIKTF